MDEIDRIYNINIYNKYWKYYRVYKTDIEGLFELVQVLLDKYS
jgi:hypothetical protein